MCVGRYSMGARMKGNSKGIGQSNGKGIGKDRASALPDLKPDSKPAPKPDEKPGSTGQVPKEEGKKTKKRKK